jgi:SAM-dependent methyltransferase
MYDSLNPAVLAAVPPAARRVLDLGCGAGNMGEWLKAHHGCTVIGITTDPAEAEQASRRLDRVLTQDLNHFRPDGLEPVDCVLASHVLEHLTRPESLLQALSPLIAPGGCLVVALPNVLFWRQRLEFLRGRFRYTSGGVMDATHLRFFDWESAHALLTQGGFVIEEAQADGGCPFSRFLPGPMKRLLDGVALRCFPGLCGWQFVFRCRARAPLL